MKKTKEEIVTQTLGLSIMNDEASQKALSHLMDKLTVNEMATFQPIVEATNDLAQLMEVKYIANSEESVQAYKDGKKAYGAYNTSLAAAKKKLKAPYTETTKAIDAIFKNFGQMYTLTKEHLALEFKPHTDEQARLKEEKEAKKNAEREKELADLKEQNKDILDKQAAINTYNDILYNGINKFKIDKVEGLTTLNTDAIQRVLTGLETLDIAKVMFEEETCVSIPAEFNGLEKAQKEELESLFSKSKISIEELYTARLKELVELQNARALKAAEPVKDSFYSSPPQPPVNPVIEVIPENTNEEYGFNPVNFIERKLTELMDIRDECDFYVEEFNKEDKVLASDLSTMLTRALTHINSKK